MTSSINLAIQTAPLALMVHTSGLRMHLYRLTYLLECTLSIFGAGNSSSPSIPKSLETAGTSSEIWRPGGQDAHTCMGMAEQSSKDPTRDSVRHYPTVLPDIKSSELPRLILVSFKEPQNAFSYCLLTDTNESGLVVSKKCKKSWQQFTSI